MQQQAIVKSLTASDQSCCFNWTIPSSASHLCFRALFRPFSNRVTMALIPHFLFILLIGTMFAEVQFSKHLNDESDTPIFKKGAAFVFIYQAVTSESESKVRVFSPFPKLPEIFLTESCSLVAHRGHSDTMTGMNTVKRCQTAASEEAYELLFNRIDEQLKILDKEKAEAKADRIRLVEIVTPFLSQQSKLAGSTGRRSPKRYRINCSCRRRCRTEPGRSSQRCCMFSSIDFQFMFRQYRIRSRRQKYTEATDSISENVRNSAE